MRELHAPRNGSRRLGYCEEHGVSGGNSKIVDNREGSGRSDSVHAKERMAFSLQPKQPEQLLRMNTMSKFHFRSTVGSAVWLAILAGWLNVFAIVALLYERASHMSGRTADLGKGLMAYFMYPDGIARTELFEEAIIVAVIVTSFVVGGTVGTKLLQTIGFGKTILIVGSLIGVSSVMALMGFPAGVENVFSLERAVWAWMLPFAMGIQNAGTTLTAIGRTTHVTGTLTDLGIAISRREHRKIIHFVSIWAGFASGAGVGLLTFFHIPCRFAQLLILTIVFILTGGFYAHPAVARKLGPVVRMEEAK